MKDRIQKIWKDPVWSAVIAAAIIAAGGTLLSLVKTWFNDSETYEESFKAVFCYKVNIWVAIAVIMVVLIIVGVIKKIKSNKHRIPVPPFVNEFTRWRYQNQIWTWRWQWSPTCNFYYVTDLNIECPVCREGVLTLEYMNYRCAKCNSEIPYEIMNTTNDTVAKQILEDARKKYDYCAKYIGRLPSGMMKS